MRSKYSEKEEEILQFWNSNEIFKKTLRQESKAGEYVFYDGPPFATGTPHYGHLVASVMKDVVPRYWTMKGYHVNRQWGWDCHGLPIENIVEKELGFKTKKEIVEYGVDKFNEMCRSKVLEYAVVWEKMIPRFGRWADMENSYKTMDISYMESVWWVFKQLFEKGLIYEGYKSMHICPRCETTLSQQEVSEGYKDIKDLSVVVKFELVDEPGTFLLAWTTTPWTLPGNVAVALNEKIQYVKVRVKNQEIEENYIVAKELLEKIFVGREYEVKEKINVKDLVGKKYKPLFPYYENAEMEHKENLYTVVTADFVTTEEGTGIVHEAPAFGELDMTLAQEKNLPMIQHVKLDGHVKPEVTDFAGLSVKPIDDHMSTDIAIVKYLAAKNLLFSKEKYEHSYPHCWRCETPLLNYVTSSWFVNVIKLKSEAQKLAKKINWSPEHIKEGRFGKWLDGARDWSISRQRFWASVIPIWKCECGEMKVYGSVAELEQDSGKKISDLHKHIIDDVTVPCVTCGKVMKRIPDVLDTWFDSGSMPYAQLHYPFENKERLEENMPAQFIAEGADQTRAWFYYLHILATALFEKPAFQNVIVNGIVLAEDGKKMSKRLQNYPDPQEIIDQYGADALRFYLLTSPVVAAETINFSEKGVKEALQNNVMLLGNILSFYLIYKNDVAIYEPTSEHILDRWILAKLEVLKNIVTEQMERYDLVRSTRPITEFINELSTWYVRRSRERFRDGDTEGINTLGYVLSQLSKISAPFMPFIAEEVYQKVDKIKESVHMEAWPESKKQFVDTHLIEQMDSVKKIVEAGQAARASAGVKLRQPLMSYTTSKTKKLSEELTSIITEELNIKELKFGKEDVLETELTDELKEEGELRELIRHINQLRKEKGMFIDDKVVLYQEGFDHLIEKYGEEIKRATFGTEITTEPIEEMIDVEKGKIGIKKIIS